MGCGENSMMTSKGTRYRGLPVLIALFQMREDGNHVGRTAYLAEVAEAPTGG